MANFRRARLVAILGLAACSANDKGNSTIDAPSQQPADASVDAKVFSDAPPPSFDLSCSGNAAPTAATATITLSGNVQQLELQGTTPSTAPVATADVSLCDGRSVCTTGANGFRQGNTTDAQGAFSTGALTTNNTPLDVHLRMRKTGTRTTYVFPPSAFVADQAGIPFLAFGPNLASALGVACGQNDATNAVVAVLVTDCKGAPITDTQNVHISIKKNGTVVNTVSVFDLGGIASQFAGTFFVCNVPPDGLMAAAATTVAATYKTTALKENAVRTEVGATTSTILRPGF